MEGGTQSVWGRAARRKSCEEEPFHAIFLTWVPAQNNKLPNLGGVSQWYLGTESCFGKKTSSEVFFHSKILFFFEVLIS